MEGINFSVGEIKDSIRNFGESYLRYSIELNGLSEYVEDLNLSESEQQELYDELDTEDDLDVFENYKYNADFFDIGYSDCSSVFDCIEHSNRPLLALCRLMNSAHCRDKEDDDICISSEEIFNTLFEVLTEECETFITEFMYSFFSRVDIDIDKYVHKHLKEIFTTIFPSKIFDQLNLFYKTLRGKGLNVNETISTIHDFYEELYDYMAKIKFEVPYDSDSDFGYMSIMVYAIDDESLKSLGFGEYIEQFKLNSLEVIDYILTFLKYSIDSVDDESSLSVELLRCKALDIETYYLEDFKKFSFQDLAFKNGKCVYIANQNLYSKYGLDIKH